jgi:hypothetical protein
LNPFFGFKEGMRNGVHRDSWYPTLRKQREGSRISYCAAPAMGARAAFNEESRMKFVDPTKPYRKSGGWGTRRFVARPTRNIVPCAQSLVLRHARIDLLAPGLNAAGKVTHLEPSLLQDLGRFLTATAHLAVDHDLAAAIQLSDALGQVT